MHLHNGAEPVGILAVPWTDSEAVTGFIGGDHALRLYRNEVAPQLEDIAGRIVDSPIPGVKVIFTAEKMHFAFDRSALCVATGNLTTSSPSCLIHTVCIFS